MEQQANPTANGLSTKVLVSFGNGFLDVVDKHWRSKNFRNRTDYINYLVRKDMENDTNGEK